MLYYSKCFYFKQIKADIENGPEHAMSCEDRSQMSNVEMRRNKTLVRGAL